METAPTFAPEQEFALPGCEVPLEEEAPGPAQEPRHDLDDSQASPAPPELLEEEWGCDGLWHGPEDGPWDG